MAGLVAWLRQAPLRKAKPQVDRPSGGLGHCVHWICLGPSRLPLRAAAPALTDPDHSGSGPMARPQKRRGHNGEVTDSAVERDVVAEEAALDDSEEALVARIAADRRAGRDTTRDVQALLELAGKTNKAALDRLAK